MSRFLRHPRLPEKQVSWVLVSGEYPWLKQCLQQQGLNVLSTREELRLPGPVRYHPDLQVCPFSFKQMFVLKTNSLLEELHSLGFQVYETQAQPEDQYPRDVLCGGFLWQSHFVGNPKGVDRSIQDMVTQQGIHFLPVQQGYGACSVALVNEHCAITADEGLEQALTAKGFTVLLIRPGHIELPGYDTGFIGGCCGKLGPNELAFAGELSCHPDGDRIRSFLREQKVNPIELRKGPLFDVGGILPLLEQD